MIGGSGLEDLLAKGKRQRISTPFGEVRVTRGRVGGVDTFFVPRHGYGHEHPPHKVNYKANVYVLWKLGVRKIVSTSAVGSANPSFHLGDLVVVDQFIDLTKCRDVTFYHDETVHVDFTEPYCTILRDVLFAQAKEMAFRVWDHGTYVCKEGPRFETKAEIKMIRLMGGDLVGMTNVPEVVLARELGICYATMAIVTNWAAGIQEKVTHEEVIKMMEGKKRDIRKLLGKALPLIEKAPRCQSSIGIDIKTEELQRKLEDEPADS